MKIRWLRLLGAALLAELLPVIVLVLLVAVLGPADVTGAEAFAQKLGAWVGPIGGAVATFLLALWVARPPTSSPVQHGVLLGVMVALLDALLLVIGGAAFQMLFVFSGLGRIVAGFLGGYLVHRQHPASEG